MNVAHEFEKVRVMFDDNRLVAILEQMTAPVIPPVKGTGVPGKEGAHDSAQRARSGSDQQMNVVGQKGPGVNSQPCRWDQGREATDEVIAVAVVAEYSTAFDPSHHDMVQGSWCIETGATGHDFDKLTQSN
jgi:hypothetical protein